MYNIRTSKKHEFSCYSFTEFYLLESVHFHLHNDSLTVPPERHFLPSTQYLVKRLDEYKKDFEEHFARTLRDYLWFAAMGEARHSERMAGIWSDSFKDYRGGDRFYVYDGLAKRYPPIKKNVEFLYELFTEYDWNGSFGGSAWGSIVNAIRLYDELSPSAFIDHCADLQHNGGVAFDKGVPFWNTDGYGSLMNFLSFKFKADSLIFDLPSKWTGEECRKRVSRETIYLMNKLFAVAGKSPWNDKTARWRDSEWNYDTTSGDNYTNGYEISRTMNNVCCYNCGHSIELGEMFWDDYSDPYCSDCYHTCSECWDNYTGEEYTTPEGETLCGYCFDKVCGTCDSCGDVEWLSNLDDYGMCPDCQTTCSECGESFCEDDLNEDGLCEDCARYCSICDESHTLKEIHNLDTFGHDTYLSDTKEYYCEGCIKKLLDAGYEIWYTDNHGLVMSEDMSKLMEYPYEELLDIYLTKQFTHMSLHAGQGGIYG